MPVSESYRKKPQRCRTMTDGADAELPLLQQVYLIGAYLFRPKLIRRTTKMFCERLHNLQVAVHGSLRVITTLELFQHHSARLGHRDLLVIAVTIPRLPSSCTCDEIGALASNAKRREEKSQLDGTTSESIAQRSSTRMKSALSESHNVSLQSGCTLSTLTPGFVQGR